MTADASAIATGRGPATTDGQRSESSIYELFMGIMTIASLVIMVLILVVRVPEVDAILVSTDTLLCLLFLVDFVRSLKRAPDKSAYVFGAQPGRTLPRGLLDLLSSIPGIGVFRFFRVFRLARVARILKAKGAKSLATEFLARRGESAIYIIALAAMFVLVVGSSMIAFVEPSVDDSNIKTGADAFWWAFVTITTVGYGDRFPVTEIGRFVGMMTMAVGIGIFGVLTSYLSSVFMAPPETATDDAGAADPSGDAVAAELSAVRAELADLRRLLESRSGDPAT
jgi:voltage-gated potassium channel Kch